MQTFINTSNRAEAALSKGIDHLTNFEGRNARMAKSG